MNQIQQQGKNNAIPVRRRPSVPHRFTQNSANATMTNKIQKPMIVGNVVELPLLSLSKGSVESLVIFQ